jgi:magnesium chelatase family protein
MNFQNIKIARTIADLNAATDISSNHIAEAVQYRTLDRAGLTGQARL